MPSFRLALDSKSHEVTISEGTVTVDGESFDVRAQGEGRRLTVRVDGRPLTVEVLEVAGSRLVVRAGEHRHVVDLTGRAPIAPVVVPQAPVRQAEQSSGAVTAPMTGRILRVAVNPSEAVEAGDLLVILEAMKMENEIRAPRAGVVQSVSADEGQRVSEGTTLVVIG